MIEQFRTRGPVYDAMAWNLAAHPPGEKISARWKHTLDDGATIGPPAWPAGN